MAHLNHALIGDPLYHGRPRPPKNASPEFIEQLRIFRRQALHAVKLEIEHPITGKMMSWQAPIPADMQQLTEVLRKDTKDNLNITY
jgi:23S rRNA pseudouridine1911/1915/1917 synthase